MPLVTICTDGNDDNEIDSDEDFDTSDDDDSETKKGKDKSKGDDENEAEENTIQLTPNAILLRAELSDFYTLVAYQSDWIVHSHYLLYPNPYPKSKHLKRRWHGHPIFPVLLAIGNRMDIIYHCIISLFYS